MDFAQVFIALILIVLIGLLIWGQLYQGY